MFRDFEIKELEKEKFPQSLLEIPETPKKLFYRGNIDDNNCVNLCVVGSRKATDYGSRVCREIISGLKGYPINIISGLAIGIDSIAHEEAIKAGLKTIAFPGSGLGEKFIYPRHNISLAKKILENGGALVSELEESVGASNWTFPKRNRIMAGFSKAILVIEAEIKSGTLITARLATEYNKDVLTVPGSIFNSSSEGPHMLIKLGATPICSARDVISALGINTLENKEDGLDFSDCGELEKSILENLTEPKERDFLCNFLNINPRELGEVLTLLEIKGLIKELGGKIYINKN